MVARAHRRRAWRTALSWLFCILTKTLPSRGSRLGAMSLSKAIRRRGTYDDVIDLCRLPIANAILVLFLRSTFEAFSLHAKNAIRNALVVIACVNTTKFRSIFSFVGGDKILSKAKRRTGILELSTGFYAIPLAIAIRLCFFYNLISSFNTSVSSACFKPSVVYFHKKKALR